ncbi:conserved membrane hypothetical protein [Sphingomonas sp. AX6]|nr:conserved membrane hypothetical protein [Sphingomonas sp. AX6]
MWMLSIELTFLIGAVFGMLAGVFASRKIGCLLLLPIPIAMFVYVGEWQDQHPESLKSTSVLDFYFSALWPSLGALLGLWTGRYLRARMREK